MKKSEMKPFKERLLAMRARLRGDVNQMAESALSKNRMDANGDLSSMPIHMADLGSDNFEQEFTLSLLETEEDTLDAIEAAFAEDRRGILRSMRRLPGPHSQGKAQCHPLRHALRQVRRRPRSRVMRRPSTEFRSIAM